MRGSPLRVDRDRFLVLVAMLASQGCTPGPTNVTAPAVATVDLPPARAWEPPATGSPPAPAPVDAPASTPQPPPAPAPFDACAALNETGTIDCSNLHALRLGGPACEGAAGTCDLLAQGYAYRPRAAEIAKACFDRLGTRLCDIRARKRCLEEGVRASCPEERYGATCDEVMASCEAAHVRPTYTKRECMQALSALKGGDQQWAAGAMGPSSEGKCQLMFTVF